MFTEIIIAILLGILIGTFTGLAPGIHINLVNTLIITFLPILLIYTPPITLCIFIISMSITHTFLDTIPSIYLGAPDDEKALGVLPGHKMLLKGEGYTAVYYTVYGAFFGLLLAILLAPVLIKLFQYTYPLIRPYVGYILLLVVIIMIFKDKFKMWTLFLFILSGTLGIIIFSMPNLNDPLFPLLSGLFGVSTLLLSLSENVKIPKQKIEKPEIDTIKSSKSIFSSTIAGSIISFLPGMGPAQGAIIAQTLTKEEDRNFLMTIGGIGTVSMMISIITLFAIDKARNGSVIAISKILEIDEASLLIFLVISLIVGIICFYWTLFLSKKFSSVISKINYKMLILIVISIILILTIILSGWIGLLILITSTSIGLIAPLKGVQRSHSMGCLIIPVIFYFLI